MKNDIAITLISSPNQSDRRIAYICAAHGGFGYAVIDSLDSGTTLTCDECGGKTVVDLDTPEQRAEMFANFSAVRAENERLRSQLAEWEAQWDDHCRRHEETAASAMAAKEAEVARLRAVLAHLLRQHESCVAGRGWRELDHACAECVPGGELVTDFLCGYHAALKETTKP